MLQLLFGTAGSSREELLLRQMAERREAQPGYRCLLLVPEQFSVTVERRLIEALGQDASLWVEVLSFRRLPSYVFDRLGGRNRLLLSEGGQRILLSGAIEQSAGQLLHYRAEAVKPDFVEQLHSQFQEFAAYRSDPDDMMALSDELPIGPLRDKLQDLALLYSAALSRLGEGMQCAQYGLDAAVELLWQNNLFRLTDVYLEHFKGFTPQELAAIECMLAGGREVVVSLPADNGGEPEDESDLFAPAKHTARQLRELAAQVGCGLYPDLVAPPHDRCCGELQFLERNFLRPAPEVSDRPTLQVALAQAASHYDELEFVAADICRRMRQEGLHWRDFAIIFRTAPLDEGLCEAVLAKFGIPAQLDRRSGLLEQPLVLLVFSALSCLLSGFGYEDVMGTLKTGLAGLSPEQVDQLELYAYSWSIERAGWRRPFTLHPDGFRSTWEDDDRSRLARLEQLRQTAMQPLLQLEQATAQGGAEAISRAIYQFLVEVEAERSLIDQIEALRTEGREAEALQLEQVWEALITLLEQMAALAEPGISLARYADLLRLAAAQTRMGIIPATVDQVLVTGADRVLPASVRCAYVMGFVQGSFPQPVRSGGLLTEQERLELRARDLRLAPALAQEALEERHYAYTALTAATEFLTITCALHHSGEDYRPSPYLPMLYQIFPRLTRLEVDQLRLQPDAIQAEGQAVERLLALPPEHPLARALERALPEGEQRQRIGHIRAAIADLSGRQRLTDPALSGALYRGRQAISPTSLERFALCNFSHFCQYGLRLKPRKKNELDVLQIGSFMHAVLERLFAHASVEQLSALGTEGLHRRIDEIIQEYAAAVLPDLAARPARFQYLFERLSRILYHYVELMLEELATSDFVPLDFELEVGREIPPLRYGEGEEQVLVRGYVDRVDGYESGGALYLRVVDYKTGVKQLSYGELYQGIGLQMLLYLFALLQSGEQRYGKPVLPAGVVYAPVRLDVVAADSRDITPEQLAEKRETRRNGLLLDSEEILAAMDRSGSFSMLPVAVKKSDDTVEINRKSSSLASLEQLGALQLYVEQLLRDAAQRLQQGAADINPIRGRQQEVDACRFCEMQPVCRLGGDPRAPLHLSAEAFWRAVEEVDRHG